MQVGQPRPDLDRDEESPNSIEQGALLRAGGLFAKANEHGKCHRKQTVLNDLPQTEREG